MSIIFKIKELGPIRNSEFEFKPFSIFTGASNLGKSYAAFLVYGFFKILESDNFKKYLEKEYDIDLLTEKKGNVELTFSKDHFNTFINKNISNEIGRIIGNPEINCDVKINTSFDSLFITIIKDSFANEDNVNYFSIKVHSDKYSSSSNFLELETKRVIHQLSLTLYISLLNILFKKEWLGTFILPPARGAVFSETFSMKKVFANSGMYADFIEQTDKLSSIHSLSHTKKVNNEIIFNFEEIINGKIIKENNEIYYKFKKSRIPVRSSASSIKELAPLNEIINQIETNQLTILFEEPEAHLHPDMQRKIALFLAKMVNKGSFLQVTTHSDYFIEEISNLIKLYKIKEHSKKEYKQLLKKLENLNIKEGMEINPEIVGSYYFEQDKNGYVKIIQKDFSDNNALFETFRNIINTSKEETNSINEVFLSI